MISGEKDREILASRLHDQGLLGSHHGTQELLFHQKTPSAERNAHSLQHNRERQNIFKQYVHIHQFCSYNNTNPLFIEAVNRSIFMPMLMRKDEIFISETWK